MNCRKTIIALAGVIVAVLSSGKLQAQFDEMFTQYMNNEMFINPAYAGSREALAFTLLHRQQWVGFKGRPITTTFSISTPLLRGKMGLGLSYLNEEIGDLNRNLVYATYAYRVRTGYKSYLGFGLMGGVHLQLEKVAGLNIIDAGDPSFATDLPLVATPNFGFGMYYNTEKFYAGFSIPRMLDDHIAFTSDGSLSKGIRFSFGAMEYYLAMGRVFNVSDFFMLKPQLMVKAAINTPMEFDLTLSSLIRKIVWLGVSYRSNADISAIVGIQITPAFLVSYSYDYQVTQIHSFSSGSHEIVLSYLFSYWGKKITSPRYF